MLRICSRRRLPPPSIRTPKMPFPGRCWRSAWNWTPTWAGEFLFTIGTPFSSRGMPGTPDELPYHVYRVQRSFPVSPGLFSPAPIFSTGGGERSETSGTGSRGFHLGRPISDLLDSGELIEITAPGGTPVSGTDHD
ncbi:glycohydrolase toxin TNT-related protein [Actinomadura algeriensis]|uniref:glycohydrolase toxin TNT-related protein n=1 Tax=Actinomadura algeriensis TaxID=1679523 RepID=UPI00178AAC7D